MRTTVRLTSEVLAGCILTAVIGLAHADCSPPDSYLDNKNGTYTDKRTRIMWKRCPETTSWVADTNSCAPQGNDPVNLATEVNYGQALEMAAQSRYLGYSNWRLPTLSELKGVLGQDCDRNTNGGAAAAAAIAPSLRRSQGQSPYYGTFWTATMDPANPTTKAKVVSFSTGWDMTTEVQYVSLARLVRDTGTGKVNTTQQDTTAIQRTIRAKSIQVGDTVVYDKKDFKWVGIVVAEGSEQYQVRLTEISTGRYIHINRGPCTSEQITESDVGKIIRTGKTCVAKW